MEQEYVIGVTNKFAAFIEESEDPYDIIKSVEAESKKKKALKATISNENKENKSKDANEVKSKLVKKPTTAKAPTTDRVFPGAGDRGAKNDTNAPLDRNNRRNKDEGSDFPRTGSFRDGNKSDAFRGPRNDNRDGPRGERRDRDGPRPFRDERERRGPRPEGDRPYRPRDNAGSDGEGRPQRRERREFGQEGSDAEGRPERRTGGLRGRGGRPPGRNFEGRGGKREFDRRSGSDRTGVKPVDKRDGAGSYNWDSTKDAEAFIPDLNETNTSDEPDWDSPNKEADVAPAPKENEETDEVAAPVDEEPQELTLDEYRKLRGRRERPQFDIRKPGEGEDLSQWKNMFEIKKKDNEEEEEEFEIADCPQRAGRQKHVVGIDITFNDVFRGGRGRGRGRGQRDNREPRDRAEGPAQRRFPPREDRRDRAYDDRRERGNDDRRERGNDDRRERGNDDRRERGNDDRRERGNDDRRERGNDDRRERTHEDRRERVYEDRNRPSAPKVDDEKAFPSLG